MGGKSSTPQRNEVTVRADADSPGHPGEKSCISGPLDAICPDPDAVFEEVLEIILNPTEESDRCVLKELAVTEHSPDSKTVKVIHDGQKLKLHGLRLESASDEDHCHLWARVDVDREKRDIVSRMYSPQDGSNLQSTTTVRLLEDPLRLEVFTVQASGERESGGALAHKVRCKYIEPALFVAKQRVVVRCNVDSPCGDGKCAITAELDSRIGPDQLFSGILTMIKRDALAKGATIDFPSEREVEMEYDIDAKEGKRMFVAIYHDRASGEITVDEFPEKVHGTKICFQVLREPMLCMQVHMETSDGRRLAGKDAAGMLRSMVNRLLAETSAPDE